MESTGLRDELALDRTDLANERTLLSYIRTALGVAGLAVVIFKVMPAGWNIFLGAASAATAFAIGTFGIRRFITLREKIHGCKEIVSNDQPSMLRYATETIAAEPDTTDTQAMY